MSDREPGEADDPELDALLGAARAGRADPELLASIDAGVDALDQTDPLPAWWADARVLATIENNLDPIATRAPATLEPTVISVDVQLPSAFDSQVNLHVRKATIEVEIEVDPIEPEIWASLTIGDETVASRLAVQPFDRIRKAQLPLPRFRPVTITLTQSPLGGSNSDSSTT